MSPRAVLLALVSLAVGFSSARAQEQWSVAVFPSGAQFTLEVAQTAEERARGYMFREEVGRRQGMLFVFDRPGRHGFWMKNCSVNLDLLWLDENFKVVHMALDQSPCRDGSSCPMIYPMAAASYVLEVAGGISTEEGLKLGDTVVTVH